MNSFFTFRPTSFFASTRFGATALALLSTVGLTAHAQDAALLPPVQITQPDASSLRLRINNPAQQPARIMVLSLNDNATLLNETHREPAYGTRLKFDTLPAGRYAVLLRVGAARYRYTIQVETKTPGSTTIAVRETTTHRVESGLASR